MLDLDDIRAEVGEDPPRERPGDHHPELDDADPRQRPRRYCFTFCVYELSKSASMSILLASVKSACCG